MRFTGGTVTALLYERPGLQRVEVDGRPAYVLTGLVGPVAVGDRVVVNTTAVDLGLGTGGWDVVHWNLSRKGWSGPTAGAGHLVKLRYTSLQIDTAASDAEAAAELRDMPVVACSLHSQVPCVAAAFRQGAPGASLTYVMTDSASLPLALSDLVAVMRATGLLDGTITCGQAFGGDREAVNLHSALALAGSDAAVVGPGPGVVGTDSRLGFSGLEVAGVVDAATRLGGRPIVAVRWSDADPRPRHRGVSHHTTTALAMASNAALVPVPAGQLTAAGGMAGLEADHRLVEVEVPDVVAALAGCGIAVTTMGRGPVQDPGFFRWAGAAGALAARLVGS